jgi:hypothetical protein
MTTFHSHRCENLTSNMLISAEMYAFCRRIQSIANLMSGIYVKVKTAQEVIYHIPDGMQMAYRTGQKLLSTFGVAQITSRAHLVNTNNSVYLFCTRVHIRSRWPRVVHLLLNVQTTPTLTIKFMYPVLCLKSVYSRNQSTPYAVVRGASCVRIFEIPTCL